MSVYRNLIPGQFQIGDLVFGKGTNIKVENWDVKPYDINQQDYQVQRADEMRFGWDSFKPTTIEIQMQVLNNRMLPGFEYLKPNFWHSMPTLDDLAREWRADEVRNIWGAMKPLYVCSKLDNTPKIVFGRPGQFGVTAMDEYSKGEVVKVLTEFRRGDTLAYSVYENVLALNRNQLVGSFSSNLSKGPMWMRMELVGPIQHPRITFRNLLNSDDDVTFDLNYDIPAGQTVEINSYPWSRRIITYTDPPLELAGLLGGEAPYLDRLRFNFKTLVEIQLAGDSMDNNTTLAVFWRDAYQVI